jgi:hypothetical protein
MELKLIPNRYDGTATLPYLMAANVLSDEGSVFIDMPFGDDDELTIYFAGDSAKVGESVLETARGLMQALGYLDNRIQEACAAECRMSGLHPRNFEGELAYITLAGESASLHYIGSRVNTEWDELVKMDASKWIYAGTSDS